MINNQFMHSALNLAEKAFLLDEVPVGAVIVNPQDKLIISESHNLVEQQKDPTAHAEILAIKLACQSLQSKNLAGLDLYVTLQPCPMCIQAMIYARIRRVYFGAYDQDNPLAITSSNHNIEIYGGIHEE
ncbi:MAG: nucleoside deaminase, partial [Francisellaceae bacterium]|nr:nucleoside deaminase [Francisellaceae bacterium]